MSAEHVKIITTNRRARFEYHVEDKVECGIALTGTEVKSLREGSAQLSDAYAIPKGHELWLLNAQIPPYKPAGPLQNHDPKRTRKLLLHRREIDKLQERQQKAGYALIPLSLFEAIRNLDTPVEDGLDELAEEIVVRRLGLSPTVAAQIQRYRQATEREGSVDMDGRVKVELGVCKGKTGVDKREDIAEREAKREMDRARRSRG